MGLRTRMVCVRTNSIQSMIPATSPGLHKLLSSQSTDPASTGSVGDSRLGLGPAPRAETGTNRWRMLVPAFTTHVCLGAPYGWSAISAQLAREGGVVASCSSDWTLNATTWPMAIMIASGGISAALLASWTVRVGVRHSMLTGSLLFGSGLALTGLGISQHSLALMYSGNVLCGLGYGCAYTPPLQTMMDWFPDRRGLASGLVIAGFGSGALVFTPVVGALSQRFCVLPTYLGPNLETSLSPGGALEVQVEDSVREVVNCTVGDLATLPYVGLEPGYYLVNSGNTGLASSLFTLAVLYAGLLGISAMTIKRPPLDHSDHYKPSASISASNLAVPAHTVTSTPQYWLLFSTATLLATGGMALMAVARPMVQEVFTPSLPELVTPTAGSLYVMSLAVANLSGRVIWAAISDRIGTRTTFHLLCFGSVPLFLSIPHLVAGCVSDPSSPMAPFYFAGFCANTFLIVTIMGGVFSCLPPYEADLYGSKWVGAIHAKFLPFSTVRGLAGPAILLHLRQVEEDRALHKLLEVVDPNLFKETFGAGIESASLLLQGGSLTLSRLASLVPSSTLTDPSPFLYDSTMYTMGGLAILATLLHAGIRPVQRRHFVVLKPELK